MNMLKSFKPKEIKNFKRFDSDTSLSEVEIPESAQNRQKTDKYFLFLFISFVVILVPFLIYSLSYSDIRRNNGYDKCGNICGEKNIKYDQWDCTGQDMTDKPLYINGTCEPITPKNKWDNINITEDTTTELYDEDKEPEEHMQNASMYIGKFGWKIALSTFLSLGYCIIMVVLFRYASAVLVWGILILPWTSLVVLTGYLWVLTTSAGADDLIIVPIILSVVVLVLLFIMIFLRKRIRLVAMLFKESARAIFSMTSIFCVPAMTILGVTTITIVCTVSTRYILTSGTLTDVGDGVLEYTDNVCLISLILNITVTYWAVRLVGGIQHMVIGGAVSKWYFTTNKALLGSPVLTSALITFKFHLGTAALGSSILMLMSVVRSILKSLYRMRMLFDCCMDYTQELLDLFTKNSFVITAMHGTPFFQSGRRVIKLIKLRNICNPVEVTAVGNFVLGMTQLLIISLSIITTGILLLEEDNTDCWYYSYFIATGFTLIFSSIILDTFQIAVNTMLLCFYEDCLMHDGVTKPYAMPRGFMEFVETSKEVLPKKKEAHYIPRI